jgi:PAS domain S-box-containing protein
MTNPEVKNRRQSYRRTEDIYRKAIEELRDYAIFVTDEEGKVTNWNCGAEQILGYSESEILGKYASQFFTAEDRARNIPQKEMITAVTEGRAEDERWHVRRDGSRFWASGVMTSVLDNSGRLVGFSKVMRDMTERNRLTEERDRFFTLSVDMLCIVHLDGRFQRVNPAFETVLGFSESDLLWMKLFDLVHPNDRAKTEAEYQKLSAGEPTTFMENRLKCKHGGYRWVAWSYFPVPEDNLAFGVGRDTTELRRIHEMLRLRADELENANRVKDEFLATLSHELRTPLTSILGWSRLLRSNKLDDSEQQHAIQIIQRSAESQSKLIEDLLDVSRIITGKLKMELQPVSFPYIVDSIVKALRPTADAKSLTLETEIDPTAGPVSGDPSRLQQIVSNVLSNAIKFTPEGGRVSVRLKRIKSHALLEVQDTGVGIAAADLPYIFERFKQADSSNIRAHSGLGLGLAIVDYLVKQHRGIVLANSEGSGKGATFVIEIPLVSSEVITSGPQRVDLFSDQGRKLLRESESSLSNPQLNDLRVLVVEDDEDTRDLLKTILERCGAHVTALSSAYEALTEIQKESFEVLVSDIGMAGENGYELIRKIRALEPEKGGLIPAVALTAYAAAPDRRQALLAGFQTHLAKPVEADELLAVIATLAGRLNGSRE